MMIQLGGTVSYNGDAQYSIVESSLNIKRAIEDKKADEPSKVEIVNTVDNPVNVNITNEDEDKNIDFDEDEDYFSDEDDDD